MDRFVSQTVKYGNYSLTLESGKIARQATSAVTARMGDTVVLATVVADKRPKSESAGFFPLTVNYQERSYASGRVPGNYFRREGRPSEYETLISRLIDRSLRPLFPDGFENEVQIIVTLLSYDENVNPDIPALLAAAAAVSIAGIPFKGPVAAARVGYRDGIFILNPGEKELETSELDLVVSGTETGVVMVESQANVLPEQTMLSAVMFGHAQMQTVIEQIKAFALEVSTPVWEWAPIKPDQHLAQTITKLTESDLRDAYRITDKLMRRLRIQEIFNQLSEKLSAHNIDSANLNSEIIKELFHLVEKNIVRQNILNGELRIDGRDTKTVRPIRIELGLLPRSHGSVLFTRGETQAIVAATLGTARDAQMIDAIGGERKENFMLHYNFPPYSVGETGQVGSPKRREIGHGRLAWRALKAVLPAEKEFPYVLRLVSEITESNGSSSMATVCGGSLALMDAGVPLKASVAGIAMGLVKEGEKFAVLTDILGDEDHLGDMDFKVAGTAQGITALQMDIKIDGINKDVMEAALSQAREGRMHILSVMNTVLAESRTSVSKFAPRIMTLKINQDKIREVIGKGGATIRALTEETGVTIDIDESGMITIASPDEQTGQAAIERINDIVAEVEEGQVYNGKVTRIADFGAFVSIGHNKEGLLHISQIAHERVEKVTDYLNEGDMIQVKVIEIDRQGRIRLSAKALIEPPVKPAAESTHSEHQNTLVDNEES